MYNYTSLDALCTLLSESNISLSKYPVCRGVTKWVEEFAHVDRFIKILIFIAVLSENAFLIYVFSAFPSLKSPTNTLLRSLSCADLLVAIGFACGYLIDDGGNIYLLSARVFAMNAPNMASIVHTLLIGMDRCFAIFMPLRYSSLVTDTRMKIALFLVWCYTLTSSAMAFVVPLAVKIKFDDIALFVLVHGSIVYLGSLASLCLMHGKIAILAKKLQRQVATVSRQHQPVTSLKATKKTTLILLTFIIGWTPLLCISYSTAVFGVVYSPELGALLYMISPNFAVATVCTNIFIYAGTSKEFRRACTTTLSKIWGTLRCQQV